MEQDDVERSIAEARPAYPTDHPAVLAALDELQVAAFRRRRLRWHGRLRTGVLVGIASVTVVTTVAAAALVARTGWFTDPTTEQNSSEWLQVGASDYPAVVESLAPEHVSYPEGVMARDAAAWVMESTMTTGGLVQEVSVIRGYETFGQCSWVRVWMSAPPGAAVRDEAATRLAEVASWPAFIETDGGGQVDAAVALADAARAGDEEQVAVQGQILCPPGLLEGE